MQPENKQILAIVPSTQNHTGYQHQQQQQCHPHLPRHQQQQSPHHDHHSYRPEQLLQQAIQVPLV
jgi:hypothetical protein